MYTARPLFNDSGAGVAQLFPDNAFVTAERAIQGETAAADHAVFATARKRFSLYGGGNSKPRRGNKGSLVLSDANTLRRENARALKVTKRSTMARIDNHAATGCSVAEGAGV